MIVVEASPSFASITLWEDKEHTVVFELPEAFDLILVHDLGAGAVLHPSQKSVHQR